MSSSLTIPIGAGIPNAPPYMGQVYFDINKNCSYLYDGTNWVHLLGDPAVKIYQSPDYLCTLHPGLAQLKQELDTAQEKFDAYLTLVKNNG